MARLDRYETRTGSEEAAYSQISRPGIRTGPTIIGPKQTPEYLGAKVRLSVHLNGTGPVTTVSGTIENMIHDTEFGQILLLKDWTSRPQIHLEASKKIQMPYTIPVVWKDVKDLLDYQPKQ